MGGQVIEGFSVNVLSGDIGVGCRVSVTCTDESYDIDAADWPEDHEIASALGVSKVRFVDAGDHSKFAESIYEVVSV